MLVGARVPIRVALVDDYELVATGLSHMLAGYATRIELIVIDGGDVRQRIDIALHDGFGQTSVSAARQRALSHPLVARRVVYTWAFQPALAERAIQEGASGVLSKTLPACALVDALEQVHAGSIVVSPALCASEGRWPGGQQGLSSREGEVIALITGGLSNAEIAKAMYLSPNSVKSYIRSAYRKIGVARRSQAVAWGMRHGLHAGYIPAVSDGASVASPAEVPMDVRPAARHLRVARLA